MLFLHQLVKTLDTTLAHLHLDAIIQGLNISSKTPSKVSFPVGKSEIEESLREINITNNVRRESCG